MGADAFFLPAVLGLGVVSTLQDFRVRRISNLWIIISLSFAVIAHTVLFVSGDQQEAFWLSRAFVNVLASVIIAIFFWRQSWWGGGDAKLFICYSALIPLPHYPFVYFAYYFDSFLLLVLTFVPAAIWTFLHAQFNLIKAGKSIIDDFRPSKAHRWEFLQLSFGFTAIFFLSNLLALFLKHHFYWIKDLPVIIGLFSILYYKNVFRLFKERLWLAFGSWVLGICVIVYVPFFHQINIGSILINSFLYCMLIFILRLYMFRTVELYVDWTKNNNMAFAGWMFLGVLVIWFFKTVPWLMNLFYLK